MEHCLFLDIWSAEEYQRQDLHMLQYLHNQVHQVQVQAQLLQGYMNGGKELVVEALVGVLRKHIQAY